MSEQPDPVTSKAENGNTYLKCIFNVLDVHFAEIRALLQYRIYPHISQKFKPKIYETKLGGQFICENRKIPPQIQVKNIVVMFIILQLCNASCHTTPHPERHTPKSCHIVITTLPPHRHTQTDTLPRVSYLSPTQPNHLHKDPLSKCCYS